MSDTVSVKALRDEYDGDWHVAHFACATCYGEQQSLAPVVTNRVECPYCHAFNTISLVNITRVIYLSRFRDDEVIVF